MSLEKHIIPFVPWLLNDVPIYLECCFVSDLMITTSLVVSISHSCGTETTSPFMYLW